MAVVLAGVDMADAQRCLQRVVVDEYISQLSPSIDLRQEWAVVGAPQDDTGETNAGAAFVLRRDDSGTPTDQEDDLWIDHAKLIASDASWSAYFGIDVALTAPSDWLVVGAYSDSRTANYAGAAYLFRRADAGTAGDLSDDTWVEFEDHSGRRRH